MLGDDECRSDQVMARVKLLSDESWSERNPLFGPLFRPISSNSEPKMSENLKLDAASQVSTSLPLDLLLKLKVSPERLE